MDDKSFVTLKGFFDNSVQAWAKFKGFYPSSTSKEEFSTLFTRLVTRFQSSLKCDNIWATLRNRSQNDECQRKAESRMITTLSVMNENLV